jgi:hypothetical protein
LPNHPEAKDGHGLADSHLGVEHTVERNRADVRKHPQQRIGALGQRAVADERGRNDVL